MVGWTLPLVCRLGVNEPVRVPTVFTKPRTAAGKNLIVIFEPKSPSRQAPDLPYQNGVELLDPGSGFHWRRACGAWARPDAIHEAACSGQRLSCPRYVLRREPYILQHFIAEAHAGRFQRLDRMASAEALHIVLMKLDRLLIEGLLPAAWACL